MKPQHTLGQATTPDGGEIVLYERDGAYFIRVNGLELMTSRAHGSEEDLAAATRERRHFLSDQGKALIRLKHVAPAQATADTHDGKHDRDRQGASFPAPDRR